MAGVLSFRAYIMIAIATAVLCCLVVYFDPGQQTAGFFANLAENARPFLGGGVTNVIYTPLINVFSNYYWAVAAGVVWPLLLIWSFLMLFGIGATVIGPTILEVNTIN